MTEIDDLIAQAQEARKRWRKPDRHPGKMPPARSWREILENRQAPKGEGYKV